MLLYMGKQEMHSLHYKRMEIKDGYSSDRCCITEG